MYAFLMPKKRAKKAGAPFPRCCKGDTLGPSANGRTQSSPVLFSFIVTAQEKRTKRESRPIALVLPGKNPRSTGA